jgi:thiol-disulfide isomerase/thioredoxin
MPRIMTGSGRVFLALLLLTSVFNGTALAVHGGGSREIMIGDTFESRTLETIEGKSLKIPSGDELTVVLFWATWSPRSKPALDLWQKFEQDYSGQSVKIITINSEHQGLEPGQRQEIIRYVENNGITLPVVIDDELALFNEFAVKAVPTVFFLNSEGLLLFRYASFPTSAPLDLKEELEVSFNLRERETEEEKETRGKLAYQPKNNALLYYNLGVQLHKKGMRDKAVDRYIAALKLDVDYTDPIRTLEGIYFAGGRTPEAEEELRSLLSQNGLQALVDRVGDGEPIVIEARKKVNAMERMRLLMEKNAAQPAQTNLPAPGQKSEKGLSGQSAE